jgi:hypothetical protein
MVFPPLRLSVFSITGAQAPVNRLAHGEGLREELDYVAVPVLFDKLEDNFVRSFSVIATVRAQTVSIDTYFDYVFSIQLFTGFGAYFLHVITDAVPHVVQGMTENFDAGLVQFHLLAPVLCLSVCIIPLTQH